MNLEKLDGVCVTLNRMPHSGERMGIMDFFQKAVEYYEVDPHLGWDEAKRKAQHYARANLPHGAPVGRMIKETPPATGAESRKRHNDALQAARAKHPSPLEYEREWLETVLAYLREHPEKTWKEACRELGIDWQMGPSKLDSSGLVISADAEGIRQTEPTPGFWPEDRKDHRREARIEHYCRLGVPSEQAGDLVSEELGLQGRRYDYARGLSDADTAFCRQFNYPGRPCTGISKRKCADGEIWEPVYS
jgi:hypothetical protein